MDRELSSERNSATAKLLSSSDPVDAAAVLLGARLAAGPVVVRITEVEAYGGPEGGPWPDPAAHSYRGRTLRNRVMFGPAGHLYVYRSYGIHLCANVSVGQDGTAGAVLLRGAEVLEGEDPVRARRPAATPTVALARGPGNLGQALGFTLDDNGVDLLAAGSPYTLTVGERPRTIERGPRVGVSLAADRPWRLWIPGAVGVSAYRRSPRAPLPSAPNM